jgi:hypothetical protein
VTTSHGERVALTAFVTYAVLAGGNAVGVRFSNRELAPLWGAGLRFALAAALLVAVMVVFRLGCHGVEHWSAHCFTVCSTLPARLG